ncbi:hypothetical protein B0I33_110179 [Prauserella shujinwangii]|uniref:AEC family transporter n=1 Tax=Prauserella shujinwangii TaxID=1453103 RepID=A0A2T0LP91_9PSEU|nr:AEC family transporter [Prauserella shujinwangii]PRX45080.1 hypothetical protein B0I33_110179 [Prauserella shujinwangii]
MTGALVAFAPIWSLTGLGYLLSRFAVLGERADTVLTRFAFTVAMPAVLFSTLIDTPFSALLNPGLIAFACATAVTGLIGLAASWAVFRRGLAERTVSGMAACYINAANLGIPVVLTVLGDASFIVAVLLLQTLVMMPAMLALLETGRPRDGAGRWRTLLLLPVRNPIIAASVLGVLVGTTGLRPPEVVLRPIHTLGDAGVAVALLVLGMSLAAGGRQLGLPGDTGEPRRAERALVVTLKSVVQPAVAFGIGSLVDLPRPALLAAVLCSALPTAQNVFIAASRYGVDVRFVRDCVLLSTLVSMGMLSLIAAVLGS